MWKCVAIASALAFTGMITPAAAASFTPATTSVTLSGDLEITQSGLTSPCSVTLTGFLSIDGSTLMVTGGSFAPGYWACGWMITPGPFPWTIQPVSENAVVLSGLGITTPLGNCSGSATLVWTNASAPPATPAAVHFQNTTFPGSPGTCTLTGLLFASGSAIIP